MKVKTKLYLLMVSILIIIIVLSGLMFYTNSLQKDLYDKKQLISKINNDVLNLRKIEKDFLARNDIKYKSKFQSLIKKTIANMQKLIVRSQGISELENLNIPQIAKDMQQYDKIFLTLVQEKIKIGLNSKTGLQGDLRKTIHGVEENLETHKEIYHDPQLKIYMLSLRRTEKDFLLRLDIKYLGKFTKTMDTFISYIKSSKLSEEDQAILLGLLEKYDHQFKTMVKGYEDIGLNRNQGAQGQLRDVVHKAEAKLKAIIGPLNVYITDKLSFLNWLTFILSIIIAILVIIAFVFFIRSLTKPLNYLMQIANDVGSGKLDNDISTNRKDEFGGLINLFATMQTNLKKRLTEDKVQTEKMGRINTALNVAGQAVMLADADYNITYLNKTMINIFTKYLAILKKNIPSFDLDNIIGKNIDTFHKNPSHQRNMLANLDSSTTVFIQIDNLYLDVTVTPIFDDNGNRTGTVTEWTDRTDETAVENNISKVVEAAVNGDLSHVVVEKGLVGFNANIAKGLNKILNINRKVIEQLSSIFTDIANGDLTGSLTGEYHGSYATLQDDINKTVKHLNETMKKIINSTRVVASAAEEIKMGSTDLSQRTEEQSASLEETSSSMTEFTSQITSTAKQAKEADAVSKQTRSAAEEGHTIVEDLVVAMGGIDESSSKINDIISVIDGIAFQTNLLALNAAVEAARAGEQGRGFAVVAAEVRQLAQRSADAAKEIKDLIQESSNKVNEGTELATKSGDALKSIVENVTQVSETVAAILSANNVQAETVVEVEKAVSQMDTMTQQNAALVEESSANSTTMSNEATSLQSLIAFFKVGDKSSKPNKPARGAKAESDNSNLTVKPASDDDVNWEEF